METSTPSKKPNTNSTWKLTLVLIASLIALVAIVVALISLKILYPDPKGNSSSHQIDALFSKSYYELKQHSEDIKKKLNNLLPLGVAAE